jgi:LmbE family N-acetylglucosaminyl deacetylase
MISFELAGARRLLVLGAHCDDVEIGCGGTIAHLLERQPGLEVKWVTFAGTPERRSETKAAAATLLTAARSRSVDVHNFNDGFFPWLGRRIKDRFEQIAREFRPDVVFTHRRDDRHQDHRMIAELTWNTFRDQLLLEYEVPKWEEDLGQPNVYVPLSQDVCRRKVELLMKHYRTQAHHDWFTDDLFWGLLRLRGVECRSPSGFAEAFHGAKLTLAASAIERSCGTQAAEIARPDLEVADAKGMCQLLDVVSPALD